jgi:5-(carboxyamino)imidazole ribonucleotide mutase
MAAIIMGSRSDALHLKKYSEVLDQFGISWEPRVLSAHRTPEALEEYLAALPEKGCKVIIAAAGFSAHLPGVTASKTLIPVVGLPLKAEHAVLDGLNAALSMLQMPPGVPVAVVGLNNDSNAALMAAQIMATGKPDLLSRFGEWRQERKEKLLRQEDMEGL